MADDFRIGLIGAVSSYSLHYAQSLEAVAGVELAGMAHLGRSEKYIRDALNLPWLTKYPKTVEGYAERFETTVYETAEELIANGKPDAVCICTEDYLRLHYALMAIEKGLHVFMPKPFARTMEEAETLFEAANKGGVVLMGSLPHRYRAPSVIARSVIDEGVIGRPISGHFAIAHHLSLGGWKSDTSMAAGPELEVGFYAFDLMRMLMGSEAVEVMGVGDNLDHRGIPTIDNGKCLVRCENGAMASIDLIFSMHHPFPPARMAYVVGDEGALAIDGNVVTVHTSEGVEQKEVPSWDGHARELGNWIDHCREGKDGLTWQREGKGTLALILGYKQAYQSGETVRLDGEA